MPNSDQNTPEPSIQNWNAACVSSDQLDTTSLYTPPSIKIREEIRATCGGRIVRECRRLSKIFFHGEETAGWGLRCVVVGRGLYALYLKPHQSLRPWVMWSGRAKEGSPLDSEEPPMQGWAVNDVSQHSVTNNYGCGYGDFLPALFSATMMVAMCVIAGLTHLGPDSVFFLFVGISCMWLAVFFCPPASTWWNSKPFSKQDSTTVKPS